MQDEGLVTHVYDGPPASPGPPSGVGPPPSRSPVSGVEARQYWSGMHSVVPQGNGQLQYSRSPCCQVSVGAQYQTYPVVQQGLGGWQATSAAVHG